MMNLEEFELDVVDQQELTEEMQEEFGDLAWSMPKISLDTSSITKKISDVATGISKSITAAGGKMPPLPSPLKKVVATSKEIAKTIGTVVKVDQKKPQTPGVTPPPTTPVLHQDGGGYVPPAAQPQPQDGGGEMRVEESFFDKYGIYLMIGGGALALGGIVWWKLRKKAPALGYTEEDANVAYENADKAYQKAIAAANKSRTIEERFRIITLARKAFYNAMRDIQRELIKEGL